MQKNKICVMGLSDVRKKKANMKQTHDCYVEIWSGVDKNVRAKHDVGFIVDPETAKTIMDVNYVSEKIISIRLGGTIEPVTIIRVYAPCNDSYTETQRDEFFDQLLDIISRVNDDHGLNVMGDFNGRVGRMRPPWEHHLGPLSDTSHGSMITV